MLRNHIFIIIKKLRNSIFNIQYLIFIILVLSSCDRNVVFEENLKFPENRWEQKSNIIFTTEIKDTLTPYNIYINVRNAGGYQFSNLFVFFTTQTPTGKRERDTVELTLADPSGKWLGEGLGDIWDNRLLFKNNFLFPEKGVYTFTLEQAMRIDPLPQLMDIGIRIERHK